MSNSDLHCKITPWFWKRMALMVTLFTAFALWFLYDGAIKWPKDNEIKAIYDDFVDGMLPEFDKATGEEGKSIDEWKVIADGQGWTGFLKESGEPKKWSTYAAENGWAEKKPKGHPPHDIKGQFKWSAGCGVLALGLLVYLLANLKKSIRSDSESYTTDKGEKILFSDITEVDKRKWDNKGLAYLRYKGESGSGRVPIDDLKYDGAAKILDRVLENFEGDLIESVVEEEDDDKESSDSAEV